VDGGVSWGREEKTGINRPTLLGRPTLWRVGKKMFLSGKKKGKILPRNLSTMGGLEEDRSKKKKILS